MERYKLDSHEEPLMFNVAGRYPETANLLGYSVRAEVIQLRIAVYNAVNNMFIPVWQNVKGQSLPI